MGTSVQQEFALNFGKKGMLKDHNSNDYLLIYIHCVDVAGKCYCFLIQSEHWSIIYFEDIVKGYFEYRLVNVIILYKEIACNFTVGKISNLQRQSYS